MPVYDFLCRSGHKHESLGAVGVESGPPCPVCACETRKVWFKFPSAQADYPGYDCPITGKWIEGKTAHRENLARHNCHLAEPGETAESMRRADQAKEVEAADLDLVIDKVFGEIASN